MLRDMHDQSHCMLQLGMQQADVGGSVLRIERRWKEGCLLLREPTRIVAADIHAHFTPCRLSAWTDAAQRHDQSYCIRQYKYAMTLVMLSFVLECWYWLRRWFTLPPSQCQYHSGPIPFHGDATRHWNRHGFNTSADRDSAAVNRDG